MNHEPSTLYAHVEQAVQDYLQNHHDDVHDMYEVFLHDLEKPLLIGLLKHTNHNQSKTAKTRIKSWYVARQNENTWLAITQIRLDGGFLFMALLEIHICPHITLVGQIAIYPLHQKYKHALNEQALYLPLSSKRSVV